MDLSSRILYALIFYACGAHGENERCKASEQCDEDAALGHALLQQGFHSAKGDHIFGVVTRSSFKKLWDWIWVSNPEDLSPLASLKKNWLPQDQTNQAESASLTAIEQHGDHKQLPAELAVVAETAPAVASAVPQAQPAEVPVLEATEPTLTPFGGRLEAQSAELSSVEEIAPTLAPAEPEAQPAELPLTGANSTKVDPVFDLPHVEPAKHRFFATPEPSVGANATAASDPALVAANASDLAPSAVAPSFETPASPSELSSAGADLTVPSVNATAPVQAVELPPAGENASMAPVAPHVQRTEFINVSSPSETEVNPPIAVVEPDNALVEPEVVQPTVPPLADRNDPGLVAVLRGDCPLPPEALWCQVRLKNLEPYWMAARMTGDVLSNTLCSTGFWEVEDVAEFGAPGHMLDIGGNLGYYSTAFAHGGWNVTTFEPMEENLALFNATMCRNPHLAAKIKINPIGLSTQSGQCMVVSASGNYGNGFVKCAHDPAAKGPVVDASGPGVLAKGIPPGFELRNTFQVRRLDEVLAEQQVTEVDAVKIDVEGYEFQVFAGAENFLNKFHPRFIRSEVWTTMVGASGDEYLNYFASGGYAFFKDGRCQVPLDAFSESQRLGAMDVYACSAAASAAR